MKRLFALGAIVLCGHIAGVSSAQAGDSSSVSAEMPKGRSVSEFLTSDGRIDLQATQAAGFEGSLDLDGFDVQLDPATGEPLISPVSAAAAPDDEYWHDLSVPDPGMNSSVLAFTVYDNKLIAGGQFTTAGGAAANYIAAWDGSSWSPLGSGMSGGSYNSYVWALTVYNNKLIAGGEFTTAGGTAANYIAAWDGSSWSPLGSGMDGNVWALTVYGNRLIAGGFFFTAGGTAANSIAAWGGSSWSPLGSGMDGSVQALTVYDNKLIAGGGFTIAGGTPASSIAGWDGSSWSPLGSGMTGSNVVALTVYGNKLIAGGNFTDAGGVAANFIAAWGGSSWSPLGSGMNSPVSVLTVYGNRLIAGGGFVNAGGTTAHRIAAWGGSSWSPLGSGMNSYVNALTVYGRNPDQTDTDADGVGDICDNCRTTPNTDQANNDADTLGNVCDNCPGVANPDQTDADVDTFGAACDCDDNDPARYPGATEIPEDGVDQDCNGIDAITCFQDLDADGFGTPATVVALDGECNANQHESYVNTDCDDSEPGTYPGAPEIPGDGVDQNCDGLDPCCVGRVGDANGSGEDEPTIGDVSTMIDAKFIGGTCDGIIGCLPEADINQSGGLNPTCDDITIGDISTLIDYLFITGPSLGLPDCL